jgi:hypothetical protein
MFETIGIIEIMDQRQSPNSNVCQKYVHRDIAILTEFQSSARNTNSMTHV